MSCYGFGFQCCQDCDFSDAFTEGEDKAGYSTHEFTGSSVTPVFGQTGGILEMSEATGGGTYGSGSYYQKIKPPVFNGKDFFLSIEATIHELSPQSEVAGVFIGGVSAFFGDFTGNYDRYRCDEFGEETSALTSFADTPTDGDVVRLELRRAKGVTEFTAEYFIDDISKGTDTITLTDPSTVSWNVGVMCDKGGGWDDLAIDCSDPFVCDDLNCLDLADRQVNTCGGYSNCSRIYYINPAEFSPAGGGMNQQMFCCGLAENLAVSYVGGCVWESARFSCLDDSGAYWKMQLYGGAPHIVLELITTAAVDGDQIQLRYTKAGPINCGCENSLVLDEDFPTCGIGAPSAMCIRPLEVFHCGSGYGGTSGCFGAPNKWLLTFSALSNPPGGQDCSDWMLLNLPGCCNTCGDLSGPLVFERYVTTGRCTWRSYGTNSCTVGNVVAQITISHFDHPWAARLSFDTGRRARVYEAHVPFNGTSFTSCFGPLEFKNISPRTDSSKWCRSPAPDGNGNYFVAEAIPV
jgi:hypothetical protein